MELKKRTIKTCSNKETNARLCDAVERLVEMHRTMMIAHLDENRKILDRAFQAFDWGLRVAGIEAETERHSDRPVNPRRRIESASPYAENGAIEPEPDIVTPPGSTSFN